MRIEDKFRVEVKREEESLYWLLKNGDEDDTIDVVCVEMEDAIFRGRE